MHYSGAWWEEGVTKFASVRYLVGRGSKAMEIELRIN